jgi:hypothetical protein
LIIKLKWAHLNQTVNDFLKKKNAKNVQNVFTFWSFIVEAGKNGIRMLRQRARGKSGGFGAYNATFGLKK